MESVTLREQQRNIAISSTMMESVLDVPMVLLWIRLVESVLMYKLQAVYRRLLKGVSTVLKTSNCIKQFVSGELKDVQIMSSVEINIYVLFVRMALISFMGNVAIHSGNAIRINNVRVPFKNKTQGNVQSLIVNKPLNGAVINVNLDLIWLKTLLVSLEVFPAALTIFPKDNADYAKILYTRIMKEPVTNSDVYRQT